MKPILFDIIRGSSQRFVYSKTEKIQLASGDALTLDQCNRIRLYSFRQEAEQLSEYIGAMGYNRLSSVLCVS